MTDTQAPPPPDPVYLLLIDSRVANYQDIINSKQSGVHHIVFHVPETATSSKALFESVQAQIAELGVPSFTSIGLVQHNDAKPRYEMFGRAFGRMRPVVQEVEAKDPHLETWNHVTLFITMLRINYRIQYFDMMACALYSNPDWKYIIDELTKKTGVAVRASTDDTGAAALGGDWFLESHTGVNLKEFYFTEAIENYNGVLVSEPGSGSGGDGSIPAKKLILIDSRIKDIPAIINAVNADTYCLVFNYFYDTPATILSKLRFLTGENRYILDQFYYEEPVLPTRMDASGNHCTPCDDFDMDSFQLLPATLQTEYMSYTMDAGENNGQGVWPFYSQSTDISIQKPVFFQRSKVEEESSDETVVTSYESTDMSVVALNMNYKARPYVLVSDLDEIYELAQTAGEIAVGDSAVFDCVGIIQHAVPAHNGYKLVDNGGSAPALVTDIQTADPNLSSWADFIGFIQSLKTVFHMTTLDMMACALYSNPDWKYIIDLMAARENITIRASLDNTGTVLDEGNWILETNDIDLTDVYFTDKIYDWKYVLTTYIDNRLYALRWNAVMYATRSYDARLKIAAGTNNFTIETWYYETAKQTNATIVDMGTYNYIFQVRQSTNNGLAFYNVGCGWLLAESAVVPVAQWSHLAITRSGSTITFYINGVAKQTFTSAASFTSNDGTFAIGLQLGTCNCNPLKTDSALYDLRLWSVARTASQIQMNRNRIIPANTTGLVANYLLTDNSGNLNDRTANGLHTAIQTYTAARWSNSTVPIPNVGFLINNGYSLRTDPSGGSLTAISTFDDITYTDFSGVDLSGVNFANANLTGSNLTNANLTNANLSYAVIVGATLTGAITTGSSISLAITSPTNVLQLDGADDAVDLGFPTWAYSTQFCTTMTVECWFKTTDTSNQKTYAALVSKNLSGSVSGTSQFSVYMNPTGEIGFGVTNNANVGSYHNTTAQYKDAQWHHVACTYDSATRVKNIYIDGVLSRTDTAPSGFGLLSTTDQVRLVFGSDQAGVNSGTADRQFRGSLSDIRMWNVVRPATDISNNMRQRLIGNETGLVGYWKLNQGGSGTTGWATYTRVLDSASNRAHGTLSGTTGGANWVLSTGGISFQPRISTITLGADTGAFRITDNSFSFIDPSSNSLGDFTYTVSPGTVATVANGASTRKTVYATSSAVLVNFPQLTTFDFPELASLTDWQIDISFTQTSNAGSFRALIGDMYNEINTARGWGLWVSNNNRIHWSWSVAYTDITTISVSLGTPYVLTVLQSGGTITLTLRTVSTGATQTGSLSVGSNIMGRGPVTIGGWRASATENFPGTISYVNVSVPTNERVVTLLSLTGGSPATLTATQEGGGGFSAGTKGEELIVVASGEATAAPTIGALTVPAKNFGDASFNLTAPTSNSSGAFTYTSSAPSVATVTSGGTVVIVGAGTTTITATQAATASYRSKSVSVTLVVSPAAPTIGALTSYKKNLGDASFNITAPTSNSSGAFTYTSSVAGVATITSGGTVTIVGAGNTTITATQAATANYTSGTAVTSTISVSYSKPFVLALDGNDDYVNIGTPSWCNETQFRETMTVEFWFKTTNTNPQAKAFPSIVTRNYGGGVSASSQFAAAMIGTNTPANNGSVSFGVTSGSSNTSLYVDSSPTKYNDGVWHHFAGTYTSSTGTVSIYVDGVFIKSATNSSIGPTSISHSTTIPIFIGSDAGQTIQTATNRNFQGFVSDVRIWNTVRSAADISNNYQRRLVGNETGLVGYWKMNQGYSTGWGTLVNVYDSTSYRAHGTLSMAGTTPTASWVVSTGSLSFQPNISAITLGLRAGTYSLVDNSFSFTDPATNGLGDFTYTLSPGTVATVANGASTRKTIYATSGAVAIPTNTTFDFPEISSLPNWQIDISFTATATGGTVNKFLVGDFASEYVPNTTNRGWGIWVTPANKIAWTGISYPSSDQVLGFSSFVLNTPYVLSISHSGGTITATLQRVSTQVTETESFAYTNSLIGKGPVTIGGVRFTSSYTFVGTISYVNVTVPTVERVVTLLSVTGGTPATVTATQEGYSGLESGTKGASLVITASDPTIGALTVPAKNFGDAAFDLTAPTSNSGGAITYTSSAEGVATVTSGGTVTIVGAGTTTITATQAASGNYNGGSVTASLVVSPIAPTIGALTAPAKNFGAEAFDLTAPTSNSSGAFTYTSSAEGVATVTSGGRVTIVGAGTATITATQSASADGNYTGGSSVTASLVVSASLSNFTVPSGKKYGDAPFDLTDPTTVDNTVGFTFTSSNSAVATIGGRTVTIVSAGSSVITASQAATEARSQLDISATLVVARITPVITLAAITKSYGDASFRLTPTSTNTDDASGATLSFTSSNTSVASIVDTSFVSINGVGTATITISQAVATTNFTDASGTVVVTVNKGTPVLSTFSVNGNKTYGSSPFSVLVAPASASDGAITYSSSDVNVATIDNNGVITLVAAGYVNFTATQVATALYNSTTKTSNTMTVHRQAIALTRVSPSLEVVNKTYGDEYFIVSATNASSGALTYESDTPSVAGVINASTGVISVVSVGTATITARRAQTAQYTSDPISWTIQVARTTTTLTGLADLTRNVTVAPFSVTATSASNGAVSYALQDPTSSVLVIHPTTGLVTLRSPGSAVIVASQAQGTLYEAPTPITATITVTPAGNALEGATLTSTTNYAVVDLSGANINNANITSSNFAGAKLSGSTFTGATITDAIFTNASLVGANLSGATIRSTDFTNADLSGATLTGVDASGTIFNNASLANVNLTGANVTNVNFTNTSIKGANITDVAFTPLQKIQLLKNSDNRDIAAIAISSVSGPTILAAISESSPARAVANLDLSNPATTVAVIIPQTSTTPDGPITDIILDVVNNTKFYLPINENEYFRINGVIYYTSSGVVRKYTTNEIVEIVTYDGKPVWLFVGSIVGLVLQTNTMSASSFVVPATKLSTDTTPFMPTTLPTSNSDAPIVYSSSNTNLATINATTGEITITGNGNGLVSFTATQVQNTTYGPGTIASNTLLIDQYLHFSLVGLNQSFNLTTLASLDTLNLIADTTDATAVFYVRLSDMTDIFKYQSDSVDVNDVSATDLKYYVFHRNWPAELKINPSHAMLNKADSTGMLGNTELFAESKMLVKHDFVRYLALKLFNTIHGVDLFKNETDLQENATYYGESIRHNIHEIMSGISTTSGDESMSYDASGNKYLTNSASGNTNLCRELMRQISASVASRYYNNGADNTGMKTVPLREEDTITFKVTIQAAATQNVLTGVSEIPSRSYTIKLVLKSSVTNVTNPNTVISDSEMFPNSYPYSSSVTSIAPDSEAAATIYNIYSPPAPIPFTRFGFNGWYYTNSSAWVGVNSGVRNHVKWLVAANRAGSSTVGELQYVRVNLKIHNKTAVPYLMVYTQGGSWRKYIVSGGGASLTNGTKYSFYMNFNSYSREPAMIGYTNKDLVISVGSGAFASNEVITNIALETDSGATAGSVEFTLASIIVGEIASGVPSEKEYGFMAMVHSAYP